MTLIPSMTPAQFAGLLEAAGKLDQASRWSLIQYLRGVVSGEYEGPGLPIALLNLARQAQRDFHSEAHAVFRNLALALRRNTEQRKEDKP
jgi:hypothetical protein